MSDKAAESTEQAVAAERERCAKICDDYAKIANDGAGDILAAAIRGQVATLFKLLIKS